MKTARFNSALLLALAFVGAAQGRITTAPPPTTEAFFFTLGSRSEMNHVTAADCLDAYNNRRAQLDIYTGTPESNTTFLATLSHGQEIRVCQATRNILNVDTLTTGFLVVEGEMLNGTLVNIPDVDGKWGKWGNFTSCGAGIITCVDNPDKKSFKERFRCCDGPPRLGNGKDCVGEESETVECEMIRCPIDGYWGEWSSFHCASQCGSNKLEYYRRTRVCVPPKFGGRDCQGPNVKAHPFLKCHPCTCKVTPTWGQWGKWSECKTPCYDTHNMVSEERVRFRACETPELGAEKCEGSYKEVQKCQGDSPNYPATIPRCKSCGSSITLNPGEYTYLVSNNYPNNYNPNENCTISVIAQEVNVIAIEDGRPPGNCDDMFHFNDQIGTICDQNCPIQPVDALLFNTRNGTLDITFRSDADAATVGRWKIKVTTNGVWSDWGKWDDGCLGFNCNQGSAFTMQSRTRTCEQPHLNCLGSDKEEVKCLSLVCPA